MYHLGVPILGEMIVVFKWMLVVYLLSGQEWVAKRDMEWADCFVMAATIKIPNKGIQCRRDLTSTFMQIHKSYFN